MKELIKDTTRGRRASYHIHNDCAFFSSYTLLLTFVIFPLIDEDPRAVLLRYARISEEDPKWVGKAYEKTQPKKILAETTGEEDQEEVKRRR